MNVSYSGSGPSGRPASRAGDAAVAAVLEQIDLARRMIARYPESLCPTTFCPGSRTMVASAW